MRNNRLFTMVTQGAAVLLGFALCTPLAADVFEAEMLLYQKSERGIAPYPSRIIVTEGKMRLDDGEDDGDFAMLDRDKRIIYSVTHSDRTVLEIPFRPVDTESPVKLSMRDKLVPAEDGVPRIGGKIPRHYRLLSGETTCYDVIAVPGLLEETVQAMGEFRKIMAGEHAATLRHIPADQQEPCDLGINIYRHGWLLENGLPVREWDGKGNGRTLVDFDADFQVDQVLFELPEGYHHYSITPEE